MNCILLQSSANFSAGTLSFKDYIFSLRNIVGSSGLVKAVGIGKGEQDLTDTSLRSEIRNNASIKSAEIIEFLKEDLSKSELGDLFWKAVWPRLLSEGWHSERVHNHKTLGLKHSLVFLVYGVHKFSRELVKGQQYFDSVTDVLDKVASEPKILGPNRKRAAKQVQEKFTVVDTGVLDEVKPRPMVRELRKLPAQTTKVDDHSTLSVDNVSEKSEDDAEECQTSISAETISENRTCAGPKIAELDDNNHKSSSTSPTMKHLISRKDCGVENISAEREKMEENSTCQSNSPNLFEDVEVQTCSKNSSGAVSSLGKGDGPDGSDENIVGGARLDREVS